MMRNIHLFEQFMQENGIGYDVPFTIEIKNGDKLVTENLVLRSIGYGGTDIDVIDADTNKRRLGAEAIIFMLLFSDNVKIIKKPWKPEDGGKYWYVWFDKRRNYNVSSSNWEEHSADFNRYIIGNCFKTEEEAHEHIYDIIQILQHGTPFVKWEE
ncbi:hypothetical protein [Megamonas hypermegale]|uniref:hypothetical protein n=1 Tax=Megamonas hypermegale TaxID=158847 RepID=UPI0026EB835B|nr:hypothetical protein [Megamonas hypermegale]